MLVNSYYTRKISIVDVLGAVLKPNGSNMVNNIDKKSESLYFVIYLISLILGDGPLSIEQLGQIVQDEKGGPFEEIFYNSFKFILSHPEKCPWIIKSNYYLD